MTENFRLEELKAMLEKKYNSTATINGAEVKVEAWLSNREEEEIGIFCLEHNICPVMEVVRVAKLATEVKWISMVRDSGKYFLKVTAKKVDSLKKVNIMLDF